MCQRSIVTYNLHCKITDKDYYGTMQHYLKERNKEHFQDVWYLLNWEMKVASEEVQADDRKRFNVTSISRHFDHLCRGCITSTQVKQKMKKMTPNIIWQGDRIKCMKSVNTPQCNMCMQERIETSKRFKSDRTYMINHKAEVFSSCTCERHDQINRPSVYLPAEERIISDKYY